MRMTPIGEAKPRTWGEFGVCSGCGARRRLDAHGGVEPHDPRPYARPGYTYRDCPGVGKLPQGALDALGELKAAWGA